MKVFISPSYDKEVKEEIKETILQRNPRAEFTDDKSDPEVALCVLGKNEIALKKSSKCLTVTKIALNQIYRFGIDPFEWSFDTLVMMNLFLYNKTFSILNVNRKREKSIVTMIKHMHGEFSMAPDFFISEKRVAPCDVPSDAPVVSPDWIDSLYTSPNYIEPGQYIFGKKKGAKNKKKSGKENGVKTPRDVIKEMNAGNNSDAVLMMQIKEKTPDIISFFNCSKCEEKKEKKKEKEIKKEVKKKKGKNSSIFGSQGNPFMKPNTDTMNIDAFLQKVNPSKTKEVTQSPKVAEKIPQKEKKENSALTKFLSSSSSSSDVEILSIISNEKEPQITSDDKIVNDSKLFDDTSVPRNYAIERVSSTTIEDSIETIDDQDSKLFNVERYLIDEKVNSSTIDDSIETTDDQETKVLKRNYSIDKISSSTIDDSIETTDDQIQDRGTEGNKNREMDSSSIEDEVETVDSDDPFFDDDIEDEIETEATDNKIVVNIPRSNNNKRIKSNLKPLVLQSLCDRIRAAPSYANPYPPLPEGLRPRFDDISKFTQNQSQEDDNSDSVYLQNNFRRSQLSIVSPNHDPLLMELQKGK